MTLYSGIKLIKSLLVASFFICGVCGLNPLFTTYFLYVRNSLDRQTWCRSYPEPIVTNLINNVNSFFEIVDLDRQGLNNTIRFLTDYACPPDPSVEFIFTSVNSTSLRTSKQVRCATMYNILDILYDELREVSYLNSTRSFEPKKLMYPHYREPTISELKNLDKNRKVETPLYEFFVALWIESPVYLEVMCEVVNPIIEHLEVLLLSKRGRSLDVTQKAPANCDKLNVHADMLLAYIPRIYLDLKVRLGEFWLTLLWLVDTFKEGLQKLASISLEPR